MRVDHPVGQRWRGEQGAGLVVPAPLGEVPGELDRREIHAHPVAAGDRDLPRVVQPALFSLAV